MPHLTMDGEPCEGPLLDEGTGETARCPDCGLIVQPGILLSILDGASLGLDTTFHAIGWGSHHEGIQDGDAS